MKLNILKKLLKNKKFSLIALIILMTVSNIKLSNEENKNRTLENNSKNENLEYDCLELIITTTLLSTMVEF